MRAEVTIHEAHLVTDEVGSIAAEAIHMGLTVPSDFHDSMAALATVIIGKDPEATLPAEYVSKLQGVQFLSRRLLEELRLRRGTPAKAGSSPPTRPPDAAPGLSLEDFRELVAREGERPWVLRPFLPPVKSIVMLAGDAKHGKTIWVCWLIGEVLRTGRNVLVCELEGSAGMLLEKLDLFLPAPGPSVGVLTVRFRHHRTLGEDARIVDEIETPEGIDRIRDAVRAVAASLVVLDPVVRFMEGDENDTTQMRLVMGNLDRLAQEAECIVLPLHHVRKAGQGKSARTELTVADIRGSGTIASFASVIALVEKQQEDPGVGMTRFNVWCGASWFQPFPIQRCLVAFNAAAGEDALVLYPPEEDERKMARIEAAYDVLRHAILSKLSAYEEDNKEGNAERGRSGNWLETDAGLGVGVTKVRAALKRMREENPSPVLLRPGAKRGSLYFLAPHSSPSDDHGTDLDGLGRIKTAPNSNGSPSDPSPPRRGGTDFLDGLPDGLGEPPQVRPGGPSDDRATGRRPSPPRKGNGSHPKGNQ